MGTTVPTKNACWIIPLLPILVRGRAGMDRIAPTDCVRILILLTVSNLELGMRTKLSLPHLVNMGPNVRMRTAPFLMIKQPQRQQGGNGPKHASLAQNAPKRSVLLLTTMKGIPHPTQKNAIMARNVQISNVLSLTIPKKLCRKWLATLARSVPTNNVHTLTPMTNRKKLAL